jgi:hypothetical protein
MIVPFVQVPLMPMLVLVGMTVTALGVFAAAQSPCLLRSDLAAHGVSVAVTAVLGSGIIALGWPTAPLPLFALLLAIHTMMPISKAVSLLMAATLTAAHVALAVSWRPETSSFYTQVRFVCARFGVLKGARVTHNEREFILVRPKELCK